MANMKRPEDYYEQSRHELIPLMEPLSSAVILDVGCGAGALGQSLRPLGVSSIHGIELNEVEAQKAMHHYEKVHVGSVESFDFTAHKELFDIVVCADVLEHLIDPWSVLSSLHTVLKPAGRLVASIPNLRQRRVIGGLLAGRFDYQSSGIQDKSHLRFFTFGSIIALMENAGFRINSIGPVYNLDIETMLPKWKSDGVPALLKETVKALSGETIEFTEEDLIDLFTHQFLLRAGKK
jgi:2-polyprenyl-3-methyl-5-hydroxy-6-metoxy-1,4-benzoquinol methylase